MPSNTEAPPWLQPLTGQYWPLPTVQRYEPCQPLDQDILAEIESFECATRAQAVAGASINGPQWFSLNYSPNVFPQPEQLAALQQGYCVNFPATDPERVRWYDKVRDLVVTLVPAAGPGETQIFELVRVPIQRWAVDVMERLATFVTQQSVQQGVFGETVILGGNLSNDADTPTNNRTNPCPFPFVQGVGLRPVTLRFRLIVTGLSREAGAFDPTFVAGAPRFPVGDPLLPEWSDMRYTWGSRYTENLKLLAGEHGWIRLLVAIELGAGIAGDGYQFRFCSRLGGYNQEAGPACAARRAAQWRI